MTSFLAGWLMGLLVGVGAGYMASITIAHWNRRPRRLEYDNTLERLRRL